MIPASCHARWMRIGRDETALFFVSAAIYLWLLMISAYECGGSGDGVFY